MLSSCWNSTITTAPRAGPQMLPRPPSTAMITNRPFALKSMVVGLISWLTNTYSTPATPVKNTAMTQARYRCRPVR